MGFLLLQPSEMASLSNSWWQNFKERPNGSTNNGDVYEKGKCPVSELGSDSVTSI